jgi:glutamate-1-semialdehyde aminotransferase
LDTTPRDRLSMPTKQPSFLARKTLGPPNYLLVAMATLFMNDKPVRNFDDAQTSDTARYGALFRHLLAKGVYVAPSQFECMFISLAHGDEEIDRTIQAVADFHG